MTNMDEARAALTEARKAYIEDMEWLRENFGIIPEPQQHLVNAALQSALSALETDDLESLKQAVRSFENLHVQTLAKVTWELLEQTKRSIKGLRETDPEIFEAKLKQWNAASWAFTTARFRRVTDKYREAIETVTQI